MPRPRIPAGEIGHIQIALMPDGRFRARARARDDAGKLLQVRKVGRTGPEARAKLLRQMSLLGVSASMGLTSASTVSEACTSWIDSIRSRATAGSLSWSTFDSYESTARLLVAPRCGGIELGALTTGRCDRIIQSIFAEQSLSAARRARSVLGLVCAHAVRDDAMPSNPMRGIQRLPRPPKKTSVLSATQVAALRGLMLGWREQPPSGPRPDFQALLDGMEIMLGTSARIGECLGIRRQDVDLESSPPTLSINGTIVQHRGRPVSRKDSPKRNRQVRRVALPSRAAAALRRRLDTAGPEREALLFSTRTRSPMSVNNYERLLRSFISDNREALTHHGIDPDGFTTHIYRRTVATHVERTAGIGLASRLLGHANEQVTRASYVVTAELVDPVSADLLDGLLGV